MALSNSMTHDEVLKHPMTPQALDRMSQPEFEFMVRSLGHNRGTTDVCYYNEIQKTIEGWPIPPEKREEVNGWLKELVFGPVECGSES